MKRTIIILSILLSSFKIINAQETTQNMFGINLGTGHLQKQDLIFSPFIARDWSPLQFNLLYKHHGKTIQEAEIRYGQYSYFVGEPFSYISRDIEYAKYPHSFSNLNLNYSLSKNIKQTSRWTIDAGARIRNSFQIANYEFGHAGQFSYILSSGIDGLVKASYRSGKHNFQSALALPVFSYLARSPYTGQDDYYLERITVHGDLRIFAEHLKSGKIESWSTSQMMDLRFTYNYALSAKWDIMISYLCTMNLHSQPVPYSSIENIIYFGTAVKF